jgi:hypothetical protein
MTGPLRIWGGVAFSAISFGPQRVMQAIILKSPTCALASTMRSLLGVSRDVSSVRENYQLQLPISNHAQKKVRINSSPTGDPCESSVKWHSGLKPCGFGKTRAPGRNATVANLCIQALLRPFGSPSEEPFR